MAVGPEVTAETVRVLEAASKRLARTRIRGRVDRRSGLRRTGSPLPDATVAACKASDGILLGAVGGPKWADIPVRLPSRARAARDSQGARAYSRTYGRSRPCPSSRRPRPLKPEKLAGRRHPRDPRAHGRHLLRQARAHGRRRVRHLRVHGPGDRARLPRSGPARVHVARKITSVDKANVLDTSRLWRDVATRVFRTEFPNLAVEHLLVDAAAMHLLSRPADFDVMVTENMFGDILTDEASMLAGSMGLLPSASLGADGPRAVRADPRLGARHRGPRRREPVRHDPECRDAAAPRPQRRRRGQAIERRWLGRSCRGPDPRHRGAGRAGLARNDGVYRRRSAESRRLDFQRDRS